MKVKDLITIISTHVDEQADKQLKRIEELFSELEISPTIDSQGRLHAPVDGYQWINGDIYLGGQFLPFDEESQKTSKTYTKKIKIMVDVLPELKKVLDGGNGKSWMENNIEVTYFYATVNMSLLTLLNNHLPDTNKKQIVLVESEGNPNNQKTWTWSTPRLIARHSSFNDFDMDLVEHEMYGFKLCVDSTRKSKAKYGAWFARDKNDNIVEGKEVRYHFPKPEMITI